MRSHFWGPLLFTFSLLVISNTTAAGSDGGRISGNVTSISGSPLGNAIIKIFRTARRENTQSVTRSDRYGFFKTANLEPGTYYLRVSHQGYEPVTTEKFEIDPGRTTAMEIVLRDIIDYISNNDDSRNWDLKTVMRSSSDRRMIFRNIHDVAAVGREGRDAPFNRIGTVSLASSTALSNEGYFVHPQADQNGVTSNFAFAEPINKHSRMILSGQVDFGYGSFWRVRNTYNYRPDADHDYRISVGYGRMNVGYSTVDGLPDRIFQEKSALPESGVQTLAFGIEGTTNFLDLLSVRYGLDYSRLHYDGDRSFTYPSLQIIISPQKGWCIRTSFTSHRLSESNSIILPGGERLNLAEPTIITMVGDRVSMSQVRHSEISAERSVTKKTSIEVAVYNDRTRGPGLPLMVTTITPQGERSGLIELNEDNSSQQGSRITINRRFFDFLSGSLAYVYGEAMTVSNMDIVESDKVDADYIKKYAGQHYHHSITGKIDADVETTKTKLQATVRWYPDNPLTPIDWFSDRMDIGTKSLNFEIRQVIPFVEFLGSSGKWEVLIDLRNVLNQGKEVMPTSDGELVLNRNPRSLRFGLSLNFR